MTRRLNCLVLCLLTTAILSMPALLSHPTVARGEDKVKKSELANDMGDIDDLMKKLKRLIRKPESNEDSLKVISDIEQKMVACKTMVPTKAAKVPDADRPKFIAAYRKEMAGVIGVFCQMEQALLDGDNKKAQDLYKSIVDREDKAHDQFTQKEEK